MHNSNAISILDCAFDNPCFLHMGSVNYLIDLEISRMCHKNGMLNNNNILNQTGATLPPLLPILWYLFQSCSSPNVIPCPCTYLKVDFGIFRERPEKVRFDFGEFEI